MADKTYIKGNAVENATSYELCEKSAEGTYTTLTTASEINFELDALAFEAGDHTLVVKAKADGYEDSDYSNEVVYTVEDTTVYTNLYSATDYPVAKTSYLNAMSLNASNTKAIRFNIQNYATYGMSVRQFPVEAGKTYSIGIYNTPSTAHTLGAANADTGEIENAIDIPYYGIYGFHFFETIEGVISARYAHVSDNQGHQVGYWSTSKPSGYTGDIPISDSHNPSVFGVDGVNNIGKIVITNLTTGVKNTDVENESVFGIDASRYTKTAQVTINDENITHMSILIGNPSDSLYQQGQIGNNTVAERIKVGVLSEEDYNNAIQLVQNGLVIVEGSTLPKNYVAHE